MTISTYWKAARRPLYTALTLATLGASIQAQAADAELVKRGEYVAAAADCSVCHTEPGQKAYAGGHGIDSPFGAIYSTNITPDEKTGIGSYSRDEFAAAVREGIRKDGAHLYPAMPYTAYAGISDADIDALYAYFMQGVEPAEQANKETDLGFPYNQRWGITFWNWLFGGDDPYSNEAAAGDQRAAYLVDVLGHCGSCHTPRGTFFQEEAMTGDDKVYLSGADIGGWHAPDIRAGKGGGLEQWSQADLEKYLQTGRNAHAAVVGEMKPVIEHSMAKLRDEDIGLIAGYLKGLKGDGENQITEGNGEATTAKLDSALLDVDSGERLYVDNCGACHFSNAQGADSVFPKLDRNPLVNAENPTGLIRVILAGARLPSTAKAPEDLAMPGFGWRLDDAEVATLASFVRSGWNNKAAAVTSDQVAEVRKELSEEQLSASAPKFN
ncbi:cytochrome c [Marinobacterium lutimaris]|uniref:Cytochrome c, mono-and diheme variants n=1 Tax=Marinobacterium lutimaris TaxID=568106 RepID=A0A1H5X7Y7_9GAMM|nr:cytochrome c [Marinobacterium lutimaris]SEG07849.1 Cytochrome c, mono-and diheme variants [Marinobacterium lutimaris]